jgi:hypothetical protein
MTTRLEQVMGVNYGRLKVLDIQSGISEAEVRAAAAQLISEEHAAMLSYKHKFEMAADLLDRAAHHLSDDEKAPDGSWWRDLFELTGEYMILTEEGWCEGSCRESVVDDFGEDAVLDEVNKPSASVNL